MKKRNWGKYIFEFLSIFIAVISGFALTNWNENRRDNEAAKKILTEIANGLEADVLDTKINIEGHLEGISACRYWRKIINEEDVAPDSLIQYYFSVTRDFFSAQNSSGYETLKSRGLELIENDSLRLQIISLYEYDYKNLKYMEEEYHEMQFQENYFQEINSFISDKFVFNERGNIIKLNTPLALSDRQKNTFLSYLWKIQINRNFILRFYAGIEEKTNALIEQIELEIE